MYRIFNISIPNDGTEEAELNRFLASHRIVSVRTQWVTSGDVPYQVFTVEYSGKTGAPAAIEDGAAAGQSDGFRTDYRKLLTQEQFVRYCKMRDARKQIAEETAVKAFVVFTNEQLAAIARLNSPTLADLRKIDGVGESRVAKYGARILASLETDAAPISAPPEAGAAVELADVEPQSAQEADFPEREGCR